MGLGVAPEGAVSPGAGAEDDLVVQRRDRCADERTHPEDPLHQRTKLCTRQFPINPGQLIDETIANSLLLPAAAILQKCAEGDM